MTFFHVSSDKDKFATHLNGAFTLHPDSWINNLVTLIQEDKW